MTTCDVIIIGAGAAGLMAAITAGSRDRRVIVLDHSNKPGKKILMSGGGRCNFTNYNATADKFISHNPHFCKSALRRYTPIDFIKLVKKHQITYHEKTLGQLFCDHSAKDIVTMLLAECAEVGVTITLNTTINAVEKSDNGFKIITSNENYQCESLIIATGGLSIPTMGATPFAYKIAEQFNLHVWPTRAGLVPLTLHDVDKNRLAELAGVSLETNVTATEVDLKSKSAPSFHEALLFTHRGLSGPAILQISSYWQPGEMIVINWLPQINVEAELIAKQKQHPKQNLKTVLAELLPKRCVPLLIADVDLEQTLQSFKHKDFKKIAEQLHSWCIKPNGTEGYRTAEVTLGGVDCDELSSQTMEAKKVSGLYFVGEAVDVTGWLGGYNFQWAWSSGWAAGQVC